MFDGLNYQFWKVRMEIFIESIDHGIWDANVNGPYVSKHTINGESVEKSWYGKSKKAQYDWFAKNMLCMLMNFSGSHNVPQQKRCGIFLK